MFTCEALQVHLESRLERLVLVLRTPESRKVWFSNWKITLFANVVFSYFEALEVLLGSILAHHGRLELQNKPQTGMEPKNHSKIDKTRLHFLD